MFRRALLVFGIAALASMPLTAQFGKKKPAPASTNSGLPSEQDMEASLQKAQAAANRPGDDKLDCDALQNELVGNMQDPAVKETVLKQGTWAQEQYEKMNAARSTASKASIATSIAMSIGSAFVPGLGAAAQAQAVAQAQAQVAQAAANQAQMTQNMQAMMAIMPQLMRSQRLFELADGKKCGWASAPK
jgi:hypothetical protein